MNSTKQELQSSKSALMAELEAAGAVFRGGSVLCPWHEDRNPSGAVYQKDGVWRYFCHGCQKIADVFDLRAERNNTSVADEIKNAEGESTMPAPGEASPSFGSLEELEQKAKKSLTTNQLTSFTKYVYTNPEDRHIDLVVFRGDYQDGAKEIRQGHQNGTGFKLKKPEGKYPLYNRTRVSRSNRVIVVEGEPAVHGLHQRGLIATTAPGGVGTPQNMGADRVDWSPLAGKTVFLWPDNDADHEEGKAWAGKSPGIEHMKRVKQHLEKLDPAPSIHWIDPAALGLPEKGDAVDWIEQNPDEDVEIGVLARAIEDCPSAEVMDRAERTISGEIYAVPWISRCLQTATRALLPGKVTLICGSPGDSKSLYLLQNIRSWIDRGEAVSLFCLEESRWYHLLRLASQIAGEPRLVSDDDWYRENPDLVRQYLEQAKEPMDALGHRLWDAFSGYETLGEIADWIESRGRAGDRIVCIDPITKAKVGERRDLEDNEFIGRAYRAAYEYNMSIVIITHPRGGVKAKGQATEDDLAGGRAYSRNSQTVLWLDRYDKDEPVKCKNPLGDVECDVDRVLTIKKCRDGPGAGWKIGFKFEGLRFQEQGIIVED